MRTPIDFGSFQGLLSTVLGLVLVSLVAVGIRLLFLHAVQRRRERENRQVNERLKVLIAAYKTLGGSFTGDLKIDPTHRLVASLRAFIRDVLGLDPVPAGVTIPSQGPLRTIASASGRGRTEAAGGAGVGARGDGAAAAGGGALLGAGLHANGHEHNEQGPP